SGMRGEDQLYHSQWHRQPDQMRSQDGLAADPAAQRVHHRWPARKRRFMTEESIEIVSQFRRRCVSICRVLLEALEADRFQGPRHVTDETARQGWLTLDDLQN